MHKRPLTQHGELVVQKTLWEVGIREMMSRMMKNIMESIDRSAVMLDGEIWNYVGYLTRSGTDMYFAIKYVQGVYQ